MAKETSDTSLTRTKQGLDPREVGGKTMAEEFFNDEELTKELEELSDYALKGIKEELGKELSKLNTTELLLLHSMVKERDFSSCRKVEEVIYFIKTFKKLLTEETVEKLYDYVKDETESRLKDEMQRQMAEAMCKLVHELSHEMQKIKIDDSAVKKYEEYLFRKGGK